MDLINEIVERAKASRQRIVLPEGTEERTLTAADRVLAEGVADLIILGNPAEIKAVAAKLVCKTLIKLLLSIRKTIRRKKSMHNCLQNFVRKKV